MSGNSNHFDSVITEVEAAPQGQRVQKAIQGIAQQMEASNNQPTQQLGQELSQRTSQLVKACQQQQGG